MFEIRGLDPRRMKDWEVAEEAERHMKTISRLSEEAGLEGEELIPMGHHIGKVDFLKVLDRLEGRADGRYIDVTAITPTPLVEGKSTTVMGLVQGLGKKGKRVTGAIRLMTGTASDPAYRRIEVDCETGKVKGLF